MAAYTRIAIDVSSIDIRHARLDDAGRFKEEIQSELNECLSLSANVDQTGRAFIRDCVHTLFEEGIIAIVPTNTTENPDETSSYDITSLRVGKVVEWYPTAVKVRCYDERDGQTKEHIWSKKFVAIVENPFYAIMNEPNSTYRRLIRKLNLLDTLDSMTGNEKLNLIIQLPYSIRNSAAKQRAEERIKSIEQQLSNSKYGIAYADATEKITQLNRPIENTLLEQVRYWTSMLYSQLGVSDAIISGEADEEETLRYQSRTVEPVITALTEGMTRTFLTKTARTQRQAIVFFMNPFKLVPISKIADIADKLTRNEIMSSNEIRQIVGMKPSDDPSADELRNKNLNQSTEVIEKKSNQNESEEELYEEKGAQ